MMDRVKKMGMQVSSLAEMVKQYYHMPPDATLMEAYYDDRTDTMYFTFKHQTFDLVNEPVEEKPEEPVVSETSDVDESGLTE